MSRIVVSVVLAVPGWQRVLDVELPAGATVQDALRAVRPLADAAGLPPDSGLDWEAGAVGVFELRTVSLLRNNDATFSSHDFGIIL